MPQNMSIYVYVSIYQGFEGGLMYFTRIVFKGNVTN